MSQVAVTTRINSESMPALVEASKPRRLFGRGTPRYEDVIREHGARMRDFDHDAIYLVTALVYLQENGVDFLGAYEAQTSKLTEARGNTHIALTSEQKALLTAPALQAGQEELRSYFENFNEVNDLEAGRAMSSAIEYVKWVVNELGPDQVAIIEMG